MFSWKHIEHSSTGARRKPLIIAHRGASGTAPENTLAAFSHAIAEGADAIELDLRLSRDGEAVVIHDATLRRTTGARGRVSERTLAELKQLDAGSWFEGSFGGEHIPTLTEVFELVNGRAGINIELKAVRGAAHAQRIVDRCLRVVDDYRSTEYVLISSFQHALLKLVEKNNPDVALGVLYHPLQLAGRSPVKLSKRLGAHILLCAVRQLRKNIVEDAHRQGMIVAAYTVNTIQNLRHCLALGITGVLTNFPKKISEFLEKRA